MVRLKLNSDTNDQFSEFTYCETVGELIAALQQLDPQLPICSGATDTPESGYLPPLRYGYCAVRAANKSGVRVAQIETTS